MTPDATQSDAEHGWRSKRGIALIISAVAVVAIGAFVAIYVVRANAAPTPEPVAVTVPVALDQEGVPADTKIGVVATFGQGQAEGAEWASAADGAVVAQYRLAQGGTDIELVVQDDRGTVDGGAEAVAALIEQDVAGIVMASSGPHLDAGISAAAGAGIPVVLPYAPVPENLELPGVWSMTAPEADVAQSLNEVLAEAEYPLLLNTSAEIPDAVQVAETLSLEGGDLAALAAEAAKRTGADDAAHGTYTGTEDEETESGAQGAVSDSPRADALVLAGHPRSMAALVAALQARSVSVPIVLAPTATSPGFTQELFAQGGTVSTSMETVGMNIGDAAALGTSEQSRAMSAYLQALRQLADDPDALNLTGEIPFAESAPWAEVRSHDAVVALVAAAGQSGSADPEQVLEALSGLVLVAGDGVATGELDFGRVQVSDDAVVALHATGQSLGLRPAATEGLPLFWFSEPEAK